MTETKAPITMLATGVPGLDDVLGGGLPELSFNLIVGAPGTGKTTLAHQLMFANASPERPGLYLTVVGEPPLKMLRYQQTFAFFDPAGRVLPQCPEATPAAGPGLAERNSAAGVAVTDDSCRSLGEGEPYDLGMVIDVLVTPPAVHPIEAA